MKRLLLTVSFDGTNYHGWQVQTNGITVQQKIQDALESILGSRPGVTGCSRTDSGVHAYKFCCHFETESNIGCEKFPLALNANLPDDIAVLSCIEVDSSFHARYSCKGKNYIYKIYPHNIRDPFLHGHVFEYGKKVNTALLNSAAKGFIGTYDYSAFCSSGTSIIDKTRTVYAAEVFEKDGMVNFSVTANGFLYNMVRIMAGTLIRANETSMTADDIHRIILSKDRTCAGPTLPAHGLYLNEIYY